MFLRGTMTGDAGLGRAVGVLFIILTLGACARPIGDLGRAAPSVIHDRIMPVIGAGRAVDRGEAVSSFNYTDDERHLRDVAWRALLPAHPNDRFGALLTEYQRTRMSSETDVVVDPATYYVKLRATPFASSDGRYARLYDDVMADAAHVPAVAAAAKAVRLGDSRRLAEADRIGDLSVDEAASVAARVEENEWFISWYVRSINRRRVAYLHAYDRLTIETPPSQATDMAAAFDALERALEREGWLQYSPFPEPVLPHTPGGAAKY